MNRELFSIAIPIFLALMLAFNVSGVMIAKAIRSRHPAVWESLGSPSAFAVPLGAKPARAMRSYIWRGGFWQCGDGKLSLLCNVFRVTFVLGVAAWVVAGVGVAAGMGLVSGWR